MGRQVYEDSFILEDALRTEDTQRYAVPRASRYYGRANTRDVAPVMEVKNKEIRGRTAKEWDRGRGWLRDEGSEHMGRHKPNTQTHIHARASAPTYMDALREKREQRVKRT